MTCDVVEASCTCLTGLSLAVLLFYSKRHFDSPHIGTLREQTYTIYIDTEIKAVKLTFKALYF